jgi:hypothetical protein
MKLLPLLLLLPLIGCSTRPPEKPVAKPEYVVVKLENGTYARVFNGPCWMDPEVTGP